MSAWLPVATKGFLSATIVTAKRLQEMCATCEPPHPYLVIVLPDGSDAFSMWHESLDSVISWAREMQPRYLTAHTAGHDYNEDAEELIAQCRSGTARH